MLRQPLRPIPASGPPPDAAKTLAVPCVLQGSARNWCWAACAEMVLRFHALANACRCKAAGFLLGRPCCTPTVGSDCSPPPPPQNCDKACAKPDICTVYGHFGVTCAGPVGPIPFQALRDEIEHDRPVQVLYSWTQGTQHVAVVVGFSITAGKRRVVVNDPWYKCTSWAFSSLISAYSYGSWVGSWTGLEP